MPQRAGAPFGNRAASSTKVSPCIRLGRLVVAGPFEFHQLAVDVEEERRIDLATVDWLARRAVIVGKSHREDIDRPHRRLARMKGGKRLLMRIHAVCREDHELRDASVFPAPDQVVEEPGQRLAVQRRAPRIWGERRGIYAIFYGGCSQDGKLGREVVGELFDDEGVAPKWEVWTVLLRGADWDDEPRIPGELCSNGTGRHPLQP